ncbi:MAG TPA: RNA polymerase sigma-70 factor [Flavitalea sp.]|nr:RNA polymerase sigma-70 factor [Flavitalea sp.]
MEALHTDQDLLQLMKEDNKDAFTALYRSYWESLFIPTVKITRSKEDAKDILQEVFLSVWNRRKELDVKGSLAAYLQSCVRYKSIDYIEKNITRRHYLNLLYKLEELSQSPAAETQIQLKEIQQTVNGIVGKMPPKMRAVYQLSRHEQLSHKEIAQRLGISDETVKKHIQHALKLIRSSISQAGISLPGLFFYLLAQ